MVVRLKTEEEIESDLFKAAAMICEVATAKGDTFIANVPLSEIVAQLKIIMARDGIGGPQSRN